MFFHSEMRKKIFLELVDRVSKVSSNLDGFTYEMIFVNDASNDSPLKVLINLQKISNYNC